MSTCMGTLWAWFQRVIHFGVMDTPIYGTNIVEESGKLSLHHDIVHKFKNCVMKKRGTRIQNLIFTGFTSTLR